MESRPDLAKIRHDLRSPINHILGYCEMLLEDEGLPLPLAGDLRRVHASGKTLLALVSRYFDETTFGSEHDLQKIQHELRTPINHILGYSEMLQEQAAELGLKQVLADLERIHAGAKQWLAIMEQHLVPVLVEPVCGATSGTLKLTQPTAPVPSVQNLHSQRAVADSHWKARILVVDDDSANREILCRRLQRYGATPVAAENGLQALDLLARDSFDLLLLDFLMAGMDGYELLMRIKSDAKLRHLPVIMISGMDQENGIARCLEAGADDYLIKPFNPVFLRARIGACLEKKHWRDQEQATYEALLRSQKHLAAELAEAGAYVQSRLPEPCRGAISADWCFKPSAQLGGDAFGYGWLDERHFAIYLLDVCGHGVGAALLSVSALNALRARSLPDVDFTHPVCVLSELNRIFPMEAHNQMYFTMWYGVFDAPSRRLAYASAGHPPTLLIPGAAGLGSSSALRTGGPPIGCLPDARYRSAEADVPKGAQLMVFSDGAYEIPKPDGTTQSLANFITAVETQASRGPLNPQAIVDAAVQMCSPLDLDDDLSFVRFQFE